MLATPLVPRHGTRHLHHLTSVIRLTLRLTPNYAWKGKWWERPLQFSLGWLPPVFLYLRAGRASIPH
jgi:hypothetical protein